VATTIVCHHPEAVLREEQHLAVPHVGIQRPPCDRVTTGPLPQSL
jgi:hypothetical protein